ncbi:regulator of G-protein signaling 7 isoform X3 [Halyomorpha halys]|uniref:regulator of G-protein signaling 7 isoform X3 n=1 Tax=Halyomorpha halys TaxID=286706 RepID=UPI0006D4CDB4|nr:regulator of G-protein signaling 7-like isoform X3 [Halyomorpha halys]
MEPRPLAIHKMEALVKQMQDPDTGVPVRCQKIFLTSIPSAFIGYDLIEWLIDHLNIEESGEAVHLANLLCQYGYIFPVTDCKNLTVKDDNSLYRFQAAYYWPWHHRHPDNVEYAIYLVKRTLRNKQRHALEDYELESLTCLKRSLTNKWDLITMQAEEQAEDANNVQKNSGTCVKVGKERKKTDKLVADSQERAYWRIHRPPPGYAPPLEPSPILSLRKVVAATPGNSQIEILKRQVSRSRVKASQAIEGLISYSSTYTEYDPFLTPAQPSNPWLSDDPHLWQFNAPLVDLPTEKRVKKWALSFEDLLADPTGIQEFTNYLKKEYSHENIRFWLSVQELRHCSLKQVPEKVNMIYDEFLAIGAPCEINIDSKTQEESLAEMKAPSRFTFEAAAHHVYTVLLAKDCYPRFIRSDQYKSLLANALQPPTKKRFFGFGGVGKKKSCAIAGAAAVISASTGKRRGSDRSLTGAAHEVPPAFTSQVPLSTSQSNLHELPARDSGVSPERTIPKKDTKVESSKAGLQVPGPSVDLVSRKLSNCNLGLDSKVGDTMMKKKEEEEEMQVKKKAKRKVRLLSSEAKEEEGSGEETAVDYPPQADICPWEDEANCKTEKPFVKKYATLGYL